MLSPLTAAAVALSVVPVALAVGVEEPRSVNLDSDPELERVVPQEVCETTDGKLTLPAPKCGTDQFSRRRIMIEDTCAGKPYTRIISTVQDYVDRLRITETDGSDQASEIYFDIRSGATGRGGEIRIVRYEESEGGGCSLHHTLFRYPNRKTTGPIPRGATGRVSGYATVADYRKDFEGKEVRLAETYVDRDDAFCCPSFRRTTFFRFNRRADEYERYRTRAKRIKERGRVTSGSAAG